MVPSAEQHHVFELAILLFKNWDSRFYLLLLLLIIYHKKHEFKHIFLNYFNDIKKCDWLKKSDLFDEIDPLMVA
jgi:hypothetical protein